MEALVECLIKADFFIKMQNKSLRDFFFQLYLKPMGYVGLSASYASCKEFLKQKCL